MTTEELAALDEPVVIIAAGPFHGHPVQCLHATGARRLLSRSCLGVLGVKVGALGSRARACLTWLWKSLPLSQLAANEWSDSSYVLPQHDRTARVPSGKALTCTSSLPSYLRIRLTVTAVNIIAAPFFRARDTPCPA